MSDTDTTKEELAYGIEIVLENNRELALQLGIRDLEILSLRRGNAELRDKLKRVDARFKQALLGVNNARGPKRPNRPKLNSREVNDIRAAYAGGMRQRDLAANYGVNPATISRTVRGVYNS